ncbi:hypothetical protein ACWD6S_11780, partial [Streptomyces zhihengii]
RDTVQPGPWQVAGGTVTDTPRFAWRADRPRSSDAPWHHARPAFDSPPPRPAEGDGTADGTPAEGPARPAPAPAGGTEPIGATPAEGARPTEGTPTEATPAEGAPAEGTAPAEATAPAEGTGRPTGTDHTPTDRTGGDPA